MASPSGNDAHAFLEVLSHQRACRSFTDQDVDDALVARVLEAATFAPSAENQQPWVFVVVRDAQTRRAIGAIIRELWESAGRSYSKPRTSETRSFCATRKGREGSLAVTLR